MICCLNDIWMIKDDGNIKRPIKKVAIVMYFYLVCKLAHKFNGHWAKSGMPLGQKIGRYGWVLLVVKTVF